MQSEHKQAPALKLRWSGKPWHSHIQQLPQTVDVEEWIHSFSIAVGNSKFEDKIDLRGMEFTSQRFSDFALSDCCLDYCEFHRCYFMNSNLSFAVARHASFALSRFVGHPTNSQVTPCFVHLNATNSCFNDAILQRASFVCAQLTGAQFVGADLQFADFSNAHCADVVFQHANLQGADFSGANIDGADFSSANLQSVRGL